MTRRNEIYPGDMICLKKQYRGLGHPDDFVVGIVIALRNKYYVLFVEKNGSCEIEEVRQIEMGLYYQRLSKKNTVKCNVSACYPVKGGLCA